MGRPSKNVAVNSKRLTENEINIRQNAENMLKGESQSIEPSARLNSNQKKIFKYIVAELEASKILGNLDSYLLETASIAIDRLQSIEKIINKDFERICDKELMQARNAYTKDFFKCCQELSLSPQSRAKFGILALNQAQEDADPLLKIIKKKSG